MLYEGAQSPILTDFIRRLWDAFPWRTAWSVPGRATASLNEHEAVMEAIRARDATLTASRLREHILSGKNTLLSQIDGTGQGIT